MEKKLINRESLKPKIISGLTQIADIVKRTLGPGGLPIIIQRIGESLNGDPLGPRITKDGVSVAHECGSPDPEEDLIIQAVKNICRKTNSIAGDGTTTAIVLGEALVKETLKVLEENPQLNPQLVRESLEKEVKEVIEILKQEAISVKDYETIKQVSTISANGDEEIGEILKQAFEKVGIEGVITVDEGASSQTTLEVVEGYQINRGSEARDSFFNNKDKTFFESDKSAIVLYDGKLVNYTEIVPVINSIYGIRDGKPTKPIIPIVFVANEFSNEVLQFLLIQKLEAGLTFCCVRGPHTTTVRSSYLEDMAVMFGASLFGNGNRSLTSFEDGDEGLVNRVVSDKYKTTFYGGQGLEEDVLERIRQLRELKKLAESPYDAQVISDRIAALAGGVAKIGVGGTTEFEIKERYDRMEDALNAARAAIQEGVIPGGGITLFKISQKLKPNSIGNKILESALKAPFLQILENIGLSLESLSEAELQELSKDNHVYDARLKKVEDSFVAGIIDPVKVTRTALENAVSIASLLSTAGGGIIFTKK
ncbi:MAG: 60 kDa chaperonin 1 [Candidatus Omnitrophica bacterium]|nr:60 kDa chaperonin 1 [Candidatus Omnitrophota bacterium]